MVTIPDSRVSGRRVGSSPQDGYASGRLSLGLMAVTWSTRVGGRGGKGSKGGKVLNGKHEVERAIMARQKACFALFHDMFQGAPR